MKQQTPSDPRERWKLDIVKRLREGRRNDGTDLRWVVTEVHIEAADEIERLRVALREAEKIIAAKGGWEGDEWQLRHADVLARS
jgi:hypothetical protein